MKKSGNYKIDNKTTIRYSIPDRCIYCNHIHSQNESIIFEQFYTSRLTGKNDSFCILIRCSFCDNIQFLYFRVAKPSRSGSLDDLDGKKIRFATINKPNLFQRNNHVFPSIIEDISPEFINIFRQSEKAERAGLNQLTGPSYRRALEFLIKDFLSNKFPDQSERIRVIPLKQCIHKINNEQIQKLADASAYIGNDLTHYDKRNEYSDISLLKELIYSLCTVIITDFNIGRATKIVDDTL